MEKPYLLALKFVTSENSIPIVMRLVKFFVLILLGLFVVKCASSEMAIYPKQSQPSAVTSTVQGGYTFLQSEKGGNTVTVSLRRARESYVQSFVSIANKEAEPVSVSPEQITVSVAQTGETFTGYQPDEVPRVVEQAAQESRSEFVGTNRPGVVGTAAMGAEKGEAGSKGGYASDSENESTSYLDVMLQKQRLLEKETTSGMVFTPFTTNIEAFTMEVPVGETTHSFEFTVERSE